MISVSLDPDRLIPTVNFSLFSCLLSTICASVGNKLERTGSGELMDLMGFQSRYVRSKLYVSVSGRRRKTSLPDRACWAFFGPRCVFVGTTFAPNIQGVDKKINCIPGRGTTQLLRPWFLTAVLSNYPNRRMETGNHCVSFCKTKKTKRSFHTQGAPTGAVINSPSVSVWMPESQLKGT